jgi:ferredoxin
MAEMPFEIWLVWSDQRIAVPSQVSALTALEQAGIAVERGCLSGGCGSCATPYLAGELIHKDACLSTADRERLFCPCVSRASGELALPY